MLCKSIRTQRKKHKMVVFVGECIEQADWSQVVRKWGIRRQSDLWTLTSFGNTFSCKQRWVIHAWAGWLIWQHLLLKIAITHPLSGLRVRTLTIYSNDVPPTMTSYRGVPVNHNVTIYSDDTSMGVPPTITSYRGVPVNHMLLYIAMTQAWAYPPTITSYMGGTCQSYVTIYSDDTCMGVPPYYYVI